MKKKHWVTVAAVALICAETVYLIPRVAFPIDGIHCESMERSGFHIHAHLELWKNGQRQIVPAHIGVLGGCFYWLHTHTSDGLIHVEAPTDDHFTLGQFFDIWGASAPRPGPRAKVLIDQGRGFQIFNGAWEDVVLTRHERIAIDVPGTPEQFEFPEGL